MKRLTAVLILLAILIAFPMNAHAFFLDFLGKIGSSVAEASWKIVAIKALEGSLMTIIFGIVVIGLIACVVGVYAIANGFTSLAGKAMKDDKITRTETITIIFAAVLYSVALVMIGYLGLFLMTIAEGMK